MKVGCILILRFYLKSLLLDFEWKFDFLVVEYVIFENFMVVQIYGFYILKVLIENNVYYLFFKIKYLKLVFLMVCEKI